MGQKVNPTGFRLVHRKKWLSNWFAPKKTFGAWIGEDFKVRTFLTKKYPGASRFLIERNPKFKVTIVTARPGLVIGKKGAEIETLRKELGVLIERPIADIFVEVEEVKFPVLDAKSVGEGIARQLERRLPFRRILKKAMQETMGHRQAGGIKVQVSGRIGGAEIARTEWYKEGRTPLHTIKANIDYAQSRAKTTYGIIGVKVWIYLGDEVAVVAKPKQQVIGG